MSGSGEGEEPPDGDEEDEDSGYRERTRDTVRDKLPRDRRMGGEDDDPLKGAGPKKGTKEYDDQRREREKEKGKSGVGSAGTTEDIK